MREYKPGTPLRWLMDCPPSDINFKMNLKRASIWELKVAIEQLPIEGNKTKIKAIEAEIRRRQK